MAETTKDTIYVDVDDEITTIIDKVRGSTGKVIALVLPKRASVFQSIVNMKLLKRSAETAKKHLVLITSEAGLLPLAGAVGLHVAKTLTSKPEIPAEPLFDGPDEETADEAMDVPDDEVTTANAGNKPIGELAGAAAAGDAIETLELGDDATDATATTGAGKPKRPKNSKLKVPDFNRFRLLLILGGALLVFLIVFLYLAVSVLPKATIAIKTNASNVNTNVDFALSTATTTLSSDGKTMPAKAVQSTKTYTQTASATGQKNTGNVAAGSVMLSAKECFPNLGQPATIPAGTGLSSGGMTFITQQATHFNNSGTISGSGSSTCATYQANNSTTITAQGAGTKYNVDSANFSVAGRSDASGSGSTTGGTDSIVQIVSQADIDSAKSKITADDTAVKQDLQTQLQKAGYVAISASYNAGTPAIVTSANAGDSANNVTVTETIVYSMLGAHQSDLKTIIDTDIKGQIDTKKQGILNEGLEGATYKATNSSPTGAQINLQTTAEVGPSINVATIKSEAVGKQAGDIRASIKGDPDVTDVTVHFSPFWVTHAPKNTSKITVTVAKPTSNASN